MPTWSVECTDACSVTGKPESTICTYGAEPFEFLDFSRVLMSLIVERLTYSVERLLRRVCLCQFLEALVAFHQYPRNGTIWCSNFELNSSQHSRMSTVSLTEAESLDSNLRLL
jgi:hypothetical protein